jgi:hypothetical protein
MDIVAALVLVVSAFLFGWFTGNVVESVFTARERRLREARIADRNKQMFLEERRDRA